jgi:hypothetical protein
MACGITLRATGSKHAQADTTNKAEMTAPAPFGTGVEHATADRTTRMDVWASSFMDAGPDFCDPRLFDASAVESERKRVSGH